jgi:hypothetical protein
MLLDYADADRGECLDTRRSTTGYAFESFGGTVAWKCRLQPSVTLPTTQAELLASTDAGKEAIWLRQLLADLELGPADGEPVRLLNDNMGAIHLGEHQLGFKVNNFSKCAPSGSGITKTLRSSSSSPFLLQSIAPIFSPRG